MRLLKFMQITFRAMCKMLMNLERGEELEMLEKDVASVYEAMLAFPLKLPWTKFYKGLQVYVLQNPLCTHRLYPKINWPRS